MTRYRLLPPVVVAGLALLLGGCPSTIDHMTGRGRERTVSIVNNNPADYRSAEGISVATENKADAAMREVCAKAGQGEPVVTHKTWLHMNQLSATYECKPAP